MASYCTAAFSSPNCRLRLSPSSPSTTTTTATAASLSFFPSLPTTRVRYRHRSSPLSTSIRIVSALPAAAAKTTNSSNPSSDGKKKEAEKNQQQLEEEEEEVEEELPWIQEKALDLVEFTGSVTQAIPGPRVGSTSFPWMLTLPLAYFGITLVIAFVKTVRNFNSPKEIRRKLVNKNAMLCKSIDELFEKGRDGVQQSALKGLMQKTDFNMEEILRKYIRYVLNENPFNPDLVANLIQLRKASMLDDYQVAEILNEISRRVVKDKGPVVMDMSGYSEKGFKRKLAVQALFGKIYYLSELPEFCSRESSLIVKEIFGVADEDADKLRIHTLSEAGDMDSLERMVDGSDSEDYSDGLSTAQ
uniref:Armadillo-like repeats domain-containing protein n=1 Tax=Davidia involucrata TaxID=16924 RepID=A0A5B7ARK2_DAVIN